MAKAVFRPGELVNIDEKMMIESPVLELPQLVPVSESVDDIFSPVVEEYSGPTADDLRREAEEFAAQWAIEKEEMIQKAKEEAESIIHMAEQASQEEGHNCSMKIDALKAEAQEEADKILESAKQKAEELEAETRKNLETERQQALDEGRAAGRDEGYQEGMAEVERLIQRTHIVLERAQDQRGEILTETEQEVIDLVLRISRKVVKVISESQREIVVSNVVQALRKVRDRGNVIIRVNLSDLKLTTEHTKNFIQMLEGVKSVQVQEDSSVDSGGCIIETDFGEVDARIASQLAEIEAKILEISPIKSRPKPLPPKKPMPTTL